MNSCHITIGFLLLTIHFQFYSFIFSPLLSSPFPSLPLLFFPSFAPSLLHFSFFPSLPFFFHKICSESMLCTLYCVSCGDMWRQKQDTPNLPLTTILYFKLEDLDGNWEIKWKITVLLTIMISKCFLCIDAVLTILIVFSNLSSQQPYETSRTASPLLQKVKLRPWES